MGRDFPQRPLLDANQIAEVARITGHQFKDSDILNRAMTPPSLTARSGYNYERLEFLGDSVLGMLIAEKLYFMYPEEAEGDLSRRQSNLVRSETLANIAVLSGLADIMHLNEGEAEKNRYNRSTCENLLEAVTAAVYLDGGLEAARKMLEILFAESIAQASKPVKDAKTVLQEILQAKGLPPPEYKVLAQSGSAHEPTFNVRVEDAAGNNAEASSGSKKSAEHLAAAKLIEIYNSKL